MFEFAWPWIFILLLLPIVARYLPAVQRSEAALEVPFLHLFESDSAQIHRRLPRSKWLWLGIFAWFCAVTAAARPQWLGDPVALPTTGRDLMMAVDISGSMEEDDFVWKGKAVTRLEAVKQVAGEFIQTRVGDRIGLILFGDRAYVQVPLSFDRETVRHFLDESVVGLAGKATSLGDAIGLAIKRLRERPQNARVLVLLTDGRNTAGEIDPLQAAKVAAEESVRIYTIGVGGHPQQVRGLFGFQTINPSRDLDERLLQDIAQTTEGRYFRAHDIEELQQIYALLDQYEPTLGAHKTYRLVKELYSWPLALALLVAMVLMGAKGRSYL